MTPINKKTFSDNKNYILLEKYKITLLGVSVHIYVIKLHDNIHCKQNLINKKGFYSVLDIFTKHVELYHHLSDKYKILSKKILKNDKHIIDTLIKVLNVDEKYTYCLNEDNLIIVETATIQNNSNIKNFMSKHIILCQKNSCAAGELVFYNDPKTNKINMIFNNDSGTYQPSYKNLFYIKKGLPYLPIKIIDRKNKINTKYFGKYGNITFNPFRNSDILHNKTIKSNAIKNKMRKHKNKTQKQK